MVSRWWAGARHMRGCRLVSARRATVRPDIRSTAVSAQPSQRSGRATSGEMPMAPAGRVRRTRPSPAAVSTAAPASKAGPAGNAPPAGNAVSTGPTAAYACGLPPWRTVRDAIGDLPPPVGTEIHDEPPPLDLHFGRRPTEMSRARYRAIPDEGMNRLDLQRVAPELTPKCWINKKSGGTDLFGRRWWDRPSVTIRTEFFKPEKGRYLHPSEHRPITHREATRLQSFPDGFVFVGSKNAVARQIGNAVPPLVAAAIGRALLVMVTEGRRDGVSGAGPPSQQHYAATCDGAAQSAVIRFPEREVVLAG